MMKKYLLNLITLCSDQQFGQDAVEWAITSGAIDLTYDLETDLRAIMGEPNICPHCGTLNVPGDSLKCDECSADMTPKAAGRYDEFCEAWRRQCQQNEEALVESYIEAGVMEEINRAVPLAVAVH